MRVSVYISINPLTRADEAETTKTAMVWIVQELAIS